MIATSDYDAWLLRWPAGTAVSPHDHGGSRGAFVVVSGELTELRWGPAGWRTRLVREGDVVGIERDVVHDVVARGPAPSLSVHAYSPPLAEMGFYDGYGVRLLDRQVVIPAPGLIPNAGSVHPSGATASLDRDRSE
jgi:hypothetical protein